MKKFISTPVFYWQFLTGILIVFSFIHISLGAIPLNVFHGIAQLLNENKDVAGLIISEIRLPRLALTIIVGMTLGLSGAALQGLLRNPLAGPDLIGVSSCAALGAVITLYFGFAGMAWFALPLGGMLGAAICVVLIFMLAGSQYSTLNLILAGVAINSVASSFIALALNFADNPYAVNEMIYWLLGSVSNRSIKDVYISLPFILIGCSLLIMSGRFLNALTLGEETALSLGFNVKFHRSLIIIGSALAVGAAVSVSGNIGFIGLVVPHLLRPLAKHEPARLLGLSAIGGAILLVVADCAVQLLSSGEELKLGVVTAMVGGPFFLMLVYRLRNEAF